MSSLYALMQVLQPPVNPLETPEEGGWQPVETRLGMQLPEDYKEFIARYGTGAVDGFLWVLNPFSTNRHLNFFDEGKEKLEALRELRHESIPYSLYPDTNGIIPWGVTDNGDVLYWLCNGPPSHWIIVVNECRGPRWREYKLSTSDFLMKLVTRELVVDVFPQDFPSESPEFVQVA
jgi:hypothetical protein